MYKLITPILTRKNNADFEITELAIPGKVTLANIRAVAGLDTIKRAQRLAVLCSGLDVAAAKNLQFYDAAAYFEALTDAGLFEPRDGDTVEGYEIGKIKIVGGLIDGMAANFDTDPLGYTLEILVKSGYKEADILALDHRDWKIIEAQVGGLFLPPKV